MTGARIFGGLLLAITILVYTADNAQAELFGSAEIKSTNTKSFTKWREVVKRHEKELYKGDEEIQKWKNEISNLGRFNTKKETLIAVNNYVNSKIQYRADQDVWNKSDYWASPAESFAKGQGDCDDYAIAKYFTLKQLGFNENDMRLVVLKDKSKDEIHAVLAVRNGTSYYILDNQLEDVTPAVSITSYEPIYSINRTSWWRHNV